MTNIVLKIMGIFALGYFFSFAGNIVSVAHAQACAVPAQVQNVAITFPSCNGDVCNFTEGSCGWGNISDATQYQVTVTEVETGAVVFNQQMTTTNTTFPVAQSNTYKCDVAAMNACGTGPAGTDSLLCKVDAAVTVAPTTAYNPPGQTPPTTLPEAGNKNLLLFLSIGSLVIVLTGITLLAL